MRQARARRSDAQGGFTLLEIMVAIAVLSITLVVLLSIVTNNIRATNHAKMTTAATLLARTKMVDIEDQILDQGFSDTTETANGVFKELGYPQFSWETTIERIELPADMGQQARDKSTQDTMDAKDPMSMVTGLAPKIGYDRAADIAKESVKTGKTVRELCRERNVLPPDELERALDPLSMTEPGGEGSGGG